VLIQSGAWNGDGEPDWVKAGNALTHFGNLALLILISIALGVAVHPVQFALVQLFEGYWGTGKMAQRARVARILHHRGRLGALQFGPNLDAVRALHRDGAALALEARVGHLSIADESQRLTAGYPVDDDDIMPTRLGNVLRKYERLAGVQYELDAVEIVRHVALVAATPRVDYVNDQRQLLDLSVRMSATSIFATFVAVAFLWHHGPWLLVALVPYCIAYLSYRGAIVVAHEYGSAVSAMIDLDRFALYDALRLKQPKNSKAERQMNIKLMKLLGHRPNIYLPFEHPGAPDSSDPGLKGP
jgi:hypothetical protein